MNIQQINTIPFFGIRKYTFNNKQNTYKSTSQVNYADYCTFGANDTQAAYKKNLREITNLPCASCGEIVLTDSDVKSVIPDDFKGTTEHFIGAIAPFEDELRPIEKQFFGILKKQAKKHPHTKIKKMLHSLYTTHSKLLLRKQENVIRDVIKMNDSIVLDHDAQKDLYEAINDAKNIINSDVIPLVRRRRLILAKFSNLIVKYPDENNFIKIVEKVSKLPAAKNDIDAFITTYAERTPADICARLLQPSSATIEHIFPKCTPQGENKLRNYIVLCGRCNDERNNQPYPKWIAKHPEMIDNAQKNIDRIILAINRNEIRNYEHYPADVKATLRVATQGAVDLDISKLKPTR